MSGRLCLAGRVRLLGAAGRVAGRVRLLGAAGRRRQGSEGGWAASLLLAAGLKYAGQGGGPGVVVIGWAGGGVVSRAGGGGAQKLTFRPLPIKPHEFFIGKG